MAGVWDLVAGLEGVLLTAWALEVTRRFSSWSELNLLGEVVGDSRDLV